MLRCGKAATANLNINVSLHLAKTFVRNIAGRKKGNSEIYGHTVSSSKLHPFVNSKLAQKLTLCNAEKKKVLIRGDSKSKHQDFSLNVFIGISVFHKLPFSVAETPYGLCMYSSVLTPIGGIADIRVVKIKTYFL